MKRLIELYKELTELQNKMMQELWWAYSDAASKISESIYFDAATYLNKSASTVCEKLKEYQRRVDELKQLIDLEEDNIIYKEAKERAAK